MSSEAPETVHGFDSLMKQPYRPQKNDYTGAQDNRPTSDGVTPHLFVHGKRGDKTDKNHNNKRWYGPMDGKTETGID